MANTASARKAARQSEKRRQHNASLRSRLRTAIKDVVKAVEAGDKAKAKAVFQSATSTIDSIADKNIIHKNKAARHKSRLAQQIKAHAEQRGLSAGQFALAWVLNNRFISSVIGGPRTREQIAAWQRARTFLGTGYLDGPQYHALLREGSAAITKYDESQKKLDDDRKAEEGRRKAEEDALLRAAAAPPAALPAAPQPPGAAVRPGGTDGIWQGIYECPNPRGGEGLRVTFTINVRNGTGNWVPNTTRGTMSMTLTISGNTAQISRVVLQGVNSSTQPFAPADATGPTRVFTLEGTVNGDIITRGELAKMRIEAEAEAAQQTGLPREAVQQVVEKKAPDFLRDQIDQLLDARQRQRVGGDGQGDDGRIGRIDLAVDGRHGQVLRQKRSGGIDRRLHLLLGIGRGEGVASRSIGDEEQGRISRRIQHGLQRLRPRIGDGRRRRGCPVLGRSEHRRRSASRQHPLGHLLYER